MLNHDKIYKIITHPLFNKAMRLLGLTLFFGAFWWFIQNFDRIFETPEGLLEIKKEREAERDEKLRDLVNEGTWILNNIPDLPPIAFDKSKGWDTFAARLAGLTPKAQQKRSQEATPRIERGKSDDFAEGLLIVSNLQLNSDKAKAGSAPDKPRIHATLNNTSTRPVIDIRVDILFMDGKDRILSRRAINPLVVSGGLFGDKTKPLFPGETRGFQADATQPPSGWINQLKAEVVYYQFAP